MDWPANLDLLYLQKKGVLFIWTRPNILWPSTFRVSCTFLAESHAKRPVMWNKIVENVPHLLGKLVRAGSASSALSGVRRKFLISSTNSRYLQDIARQTRLSQPFRDTQPLPNQLGLLLNGPIWVAFWGFISQLEIWQNREEFSRIKFEAKYPRPVGWLGPLSCNGLNYFRPASRGVTRWNSRKVM